MHLALDHVYELWAQAVLTVEDTAFLSCDEDLHGLTPLSERSVTRPLYLHLVHVQSSCMLFAVDIKY